MKLIDLSGKTFGRLTVIDRAPNHGKFGAWNCVCECGKTLQVITASLNGGNTKSCGCLRIDWLKRTRTKHGHAVNHKVSSTYATWESMVARCTNKNNHAYPGYGGRGITVAAPWLEFCNFLLDMGEKPEGMSLDRIDNDLGYSKANCRWATKKQQARNRRSNTTLTIKGETKCISEWAEIAGINLSALHSRLIRGWDVESAVFSDVTNRGQEAAKLTRKLRQAQ